MCSKNPWGSLNGSRLNLPPYTADSEKAPPAFLGKPTNLEKLGSEVCGQCPFQYQPHSDISFSVTSFPCEMRFRSQCKSKKKKKNSPPQTETAVIAFLLGCRELNGEVRVSQGTTQQGRALREWTANFCLFTRLKSGTQFVVVSNSCREEVCVCV